MGVGISIGGTTYTSAIPNKPVQDFCLTLMIYLKIPKRGEVSGPHLRTIMLFSHVGYVINSKPAP